MRRRSQGESARKQLSYAYIRKNLRLFRWCCEEEEEEEEEDELTPFFTT